MIDDAETRYLSVQVKIVDNVLVILTACSDGVLRLWNWEINSKKVVLVSETEVMDNVILKIVWHDIGFLAANTLGNITFRSLPDLKVNWKLLKLHENGINALCVDSNRIAFSGGDDGSISVSDLQQEKILHKSRQISAAHITGIQTVDIEDSIENLISVSVDQRITRWLVNRKDKSISVLNQSLSSVPDIHDMVAWVRKTPDGDQTLVAMVGNGIEIMYFCNPIFFNFLFIYTRGVG